MKPTAAEKALALHDCALNSIRRVETLVGLMEALGEHANDGLIDLSLVVNAAGMIRGEVPSLRKALEDLRKLADP